MAHVIGGHGEATRSWFDEPEPERPNDELLEDSEVGPLPDAVSVVAGVVPLETVIAANDRAVIIAHAVRAAPHGFQVRVRSYFRTPDLLSGGGGSLAGSPSNDLFGGSPLARAFPDLGREPYDADGNLLDGYIRFGVSFDNVIVTNTGGPRAVDDRRPVPDADLWPLRGKTRAYGPHTYGVHEDTYWVFPLPTGSTDVRFATAWPVFDLGEATVAAPAQSIVDAAARAQPVWEPGTSRWLDLAIAKRQPLAWP